MIWQKYGSGLFNTNLHHTTWRKATLLVGSSRVGECADLQTKKQEGLFHVRARGTKGIFLRDPLFKTLLGFFFLWSAL